MSGPKKVRVQQALRRLPGLPWAWAPCSSGSPRPSAGPLAAGGEQALAQRAARRGGGAAGSPARSTLHPPGRCPERLQDRQQAGAGNYKSNPSSRRKVTKKADLKRKKGPARSDSADSRAFRALILESCRSYQKGAGKQTKVAP